MLRRFSCLKAFAASTVLGTMLISAISVSTLFTSCSTDEDEFTIYTSISGMVVDASDAQPLSGVTVTIIPTNRSEITDETGTFSFTQLKTQQYTISVQKEDYKPNRTVVSGVRGKTIEVSITMTRI